MSVSPSWQEKLIVLLADLDEGAVLAEVAERLAAGADPLALIDVCRTGMRRVGERYEQREYFLSGLIMAGEIFREVVELIQPRLEAATRGHSAGRVLLGTVQGDIHDVGKNILQVLLRCSGFDVRDLGVDVPPEEFARQVQAFRPEVVGLSGLLTTSYDTMRETVHHIRGVLPATDQPGAIVIGGGLINEQVGRYTGADFWTDDAMEGVRLCQRLVAARTG